MSHPLTSRLLGPDDEPQLRALWANEPHAHLFAIPDLEHFGWKDSRLHFTGWFDAEVLVAYLMVYGISAQWSYTDKRAITGIAMMLEHTKGGVRFASGMERVMWPVLERMRDARVARYERSIVAQLSAREFNPRVVNGTSGRARRATVEDLDQLAAVHTAAPDQFNALSYGERRQVLQRALTDGWRRVFLAETSEGRVVAAAQTTAEGDEMAVIGGVVTHPAFRGRGHATAATAALCASLLKDDMKPYLFYRRDNAPAARVYKKIGFVPLGDALLAELEWYQS